MSKTTLAKFTSILNKEPEKSEVKMHPYTRVPYIPISYIEAKLDELFYGLWSFEVIKSERVFNEILVTVTLKYLHPIHKVWISRGGCGASIIQQESNADITDMTQKKKNALEKDFPSAKSMAFSNAAKSIGVYFGRNIARGTKDKTIISTPNPNKMINATTAAKKAIASAESKEDIKALYSNTALALAFTDPEIELLVKSKVEMLSTKQIAK